MRTLPGLLMLWLVACRPSPLQTVEAGALRFTPDALQFGEVFVGGERVLSLTVSNPTRVPVAAVVEVFGPFFAASSAVVQGGASLELAVRFAPVGAGPALGELLLGDARIPLEGLGLEPLSCPPATCTTTRFDAALGACVSTPLPNGAPCADRCVRGACQAGECLGAFDSCDDGDACTLDACAPLEGCLHQPVQCSAPADPCQAAYCDPTTGCGTVDVTDGTRCGPDNCADNNVPVCIVGRCVPRTRPQGQLCFEVVAGVPGGQGYRDGAGSNVRFRGLRGLAVDRFGNVWLSDTGNHLIRRMTPGGTVSTVAGNALSPGTADGLGAAAAFSMNRRLSLDGAGNLWVQDHQVRTVSPTGGVTTRACPLDGSAGFSAARDGTLFVTSGSAIRAISPDGGVRLHAGREAPLNSLPMTDGPAAEATFSAPGALTVLPSGDLVVADQVAYSNASVLRRVGPDGAVSTLLGLGGTVEDLTVDAQGGLVFIEGCAVRRLVPGSSFVTTLYGAIGECGTGVAVATAARLRSPQRLAFGPDGRLYIAELHALRRVSTSGVVELLAGPAVQAGYLDAPGAAARFDTGWRGGWLAVRPDGVALLSEDESRALRTIAPDGAVATLAGGRPIGPSIDGVGRDAGFRHMAPVTADAQGTAWLVEEGSVRTVSPAGVTVTVGQLCGPPSSPSAVDAAWLDGSGGWGRGGSTTVFRVLPSFGRGVLVGDSSSAGRVDGPAADARFKSLQSLALLPGGAAAVADVPTVRHVSSAGDVTTLAGAAETGFFDGQGASARFSGRLSLSAGRGGVLVADLYNSAIRHVTLAGRVSTLGRLDDEPIAVAEAPNGDIYVYVSHAVMRGR